MAGTARIVVKATNEAKGGFDQAASDAERMQSRVTAASAIMTGGFLAIGAAAIKVGMDFESGMSQVQAVSGATAAQMDQLTAKAKKIGADTAFSSTQATGAMEELAAAGMNVNQILQGGADAAVALAAAGGTSLPNAARIAATAMSAWKIEGDKVEDTVNRIAAAANVSRFGVEDMGQAFGSASATAAALGVGLPETTAAIAALADATNSGADAGTAFKSFLLALPGQSEAAKKAIREAGLEFFDLNGNLKPLPAIIQELHDKLGGLSQQERLDLVNRIFGSDGGRAALDLMQMTGAEFEALMKTMGETSAADIAATRLDNAKGSIEQLKGSLETLAITTTQAALPAVAGLAEGAAGAANAFAGLPEQTQAFALGTVAIATAAPAAVSAVDGLVKAIGGLKGGNAGMGMQLSATAIGIGAIALAADEFAKATMGKGLFEFMFGGGDDERAQAALEEYERKLKGLGPDADIARQNIERLGQAQVELNMAIDKMATSKHPLADSAVTNEMQKQKIIVRSIAQNMLDGYSQGKVSLDELTEAHGWLEGALQDVFDTTVGYDEILQRHWKNLQDYDGEVVRSRMALEEIPKPAQAAKSASEQFVASLKKGADVSKELTDNLGDLQERMLAADPVYQANATNIAVLASEIDRAKQNGSGYSTVLGMTIPQMEEAKKKLEGMNEATSTAAGHTEELAGRVAHYAGVLSIDLLAALDGAKRSTYEQNEALGLASRAFSDLATKDVPAAVQEFGTLTTKFPEVAKAIGPAFLQQLRSTITDATQWEAIRAEMLTHGTDIGSAMQNGILGGLTSGAERIAAAARGIARAAADEMREELQSQSPSRVMAQIGQDAVAGFVQGLVNGVPAAAAAGAALATGAAGGVRELATASGAGIAGGAPGILVQQAAQYAALLASLDAEARAMWLQANPTIWNAMQSVGWRLSPGGQVVNPTAHPGTGHIGGGTHYTTTPKGDVVALPPPAGHYHGGSGPGPAGSGNNTPVGGGSALPGVRTNGWFWAGPSVRVDWRVDWSRIPMGATINKIDEDGAVVYFTPAGGQVTVPNGIIYESTGLDYQADAPTDGSAYRPASAEEFQTRGILMWDWRGNEYLDDAWILASRERTGQRGRQMTQFMEGAGRGGALPQSINGAPLNIGSKYAPGSHEAFIVDLARELFGFSDAEIAQHWDWLMRYNQWGLMAFAKQAGIDVREIALANAGRSSGNVSPEQAARDALTRAPRSTANTFGGSRASTGGFGSSSRTGWGTSTGGGGRGDGWFGGPPNGNGGANTGITINISAWDAAGVRRNAHMLREALDSIEMFKPGKPAFGRVA